MTTNPQPAPLEWEETHQLVGWTYYTATTDHGDYTIMTDGKGSAGWHFDPQVTYFDGSLEDARSATENDYLARHACGFSATLADELLSCRAVLARAERFIAGFEGDQNQDGVDKLLADIRAALRGER